MVSADQPRETIHKRHEKFHHVTAPLRNFLANQSQSLQRLPRNICCVILERLPLIMDEYFSPNASVTILLREDIDDLNVKHEQVVMALKYNLTEENATDFHDEVKSCFSSWTHALQKI